MSKKQDFIKEQKQARTVKVRTVVIGIVWFATIVAAMGTGWMTRSDFDSTIRSEVGQTVRELSSVKQ